MAPVYGVTQFEFDEENDLKNYDVWFCDVAHGSPPWKPMFVLHDWLWPGYRAIQRAYEYLSVPTSTGWDIRLKDGYVYVSVMLTTDEQAKERAVVFRDKIRPFIEDAAGMWDKRKLELMAAYDDLKKTYGLTTYESISQLSNIQMLELFDDFLQVVSLQWNVHMDYFIPVNYLYGSFENMCQDLLGIDHGNPLFSQVMAGFDSKAFETNREIWKLGASAIDLGLEDVFSSTDDAEAILVGLAESDAGQKWLAAYRAFLEVYGWRCSRMLEWATPTWLEKPSLGIPSVKMALSTKGVSGIDDRLKAAQEDRKTAEAELLSRVSPDQKEWFSTLMKAAQVAPYFSEDHNFYCDLYIGALGRWITHEIGERFARAGAIDDAEDVYFLIASDVQKTMIPMGRVRLQKRVAARKEEWQGYLDVQPQMLLGNPAAMATVVRKDPVLSPAFALPKVREELKADLYGGGSAPGVAEGIARVIMTEAQLGELQPGDILVAPGTSSQWTPAFEIVKGIVTDGGGALSHACIMAREYGIPAVTGSQEATRKIKTGDRVRVDGDLGIVFINR
jgi:pyruvate, water dikinase